MVGRCIRRPPCVLLLPLPPPPLLLCAGLLLLMAVHEVAFEVEVHLALQPVQCPFPLLHPRGVQKGTGGAWKCGGCPDHHADAGKV